MKKDKKIISIDVGGHRVKGGIVDIFSQRISDTQTITYPSVLADPSIEKSLVLGKERTNAACKLIQNLYKKYSNEISHITISSTDIVNHINGRIIRSTSKSYEGVSWPKEIGLHTTVNRNIKLYVQNDTKCGVFGEYMTWSQHPDYYKRKEPKLFIRVTVGSGVGSGIIIDGKVLDGAGFVAGECAYIPFLPESGFNCEYGIGCVEKHASASGIIRTVKESLLDSNSLIHKSYDLFKLNLRDIQLLINANDEIVLQSIKYCAKSLGVAISVIINLFGPEVLFIGGGVIEMIPIYFDFVLDYVLCNTLQPAVSNCLILKSTRRDFETVILGAAYLGLDYGKPIKDY